MITDFRPCSAGRTTMTNVFRNQSAALHSGAILIWLALGVLGCASGLQAPSPSQLIGLTHDFDETTIYWPTSKSFKLAPVHKGETAHGFWYEANNFEAAEHGGTHMGAPVHFAKDKWTVDQIPLSHLIGPGVLIDISTRAQGQPDTLVSKQDVMN